MGITGWKFRLKKVSSLRAPPLLKLNSNGTETISPTGFCVVFARSVALCSAGGACPFISKHEISMPTIVKRMNRILKKGILRAYDAELRLTVQKIGIVF